MAKACGKKWRKIMRRNSLGRIVQAHLSRIAEHPEHGKPLADPVFAGMMSWAFRTDSGQHRTIYRADADSQTITVHAIAPAETSTAS